MKASDNAFPKLLLVVTTGAATPATGQFAVFAKSTGLFYVDDAGVEHALAGGGAGGGAAWGSITGTLASQMDLAAALAAKATAGQLAGINNQTGTAYTLVLADAGKDVRCANAAAVALTVPPNSAVAFPIGAWLLFSQAGAGVVTATAGAGVTINAANGVATTAQHDVRGLEKTAPDTWRVI